MNWTPIGDRVLVKSNVKEKTESGLFLPQDAMMNREGVVVAVGKGVYTQNGSFIETTVKVGDTVMVGNASDLDVDGKQYQLCREMDLLLVRNSD